MPTIMFALPDVSPFIKRDTLPLKLVATEYAALAVHSASIAASFAVSAAYELRSYGQVEINHHSHFTVLLSEDEDRNPRSMLDVHESWINFTELALRLSVTNRLPGRRKLGNLMPGLSTSAIVAEELQAEIVHLLNVTADLHLISWQALEMLRDMSKEFGFTQVSLPGGRILDISDWDAFTAGLTEDVTDAIEIAFNDAIDAALPKQAADELV